MHDGLHHDLQLVVPECEQLLAAFLVPSALAVGLFDVFGHEPCEQPDRFEVTFLDVVEDAMTEAAERPVHRSVGEDEGHGEVRPDGKFVGDRQVTGDGVA